MATVGAAAGQDDRSQMIFFLNQALDKDDNKRRQAETVFANVQSSNAGGYFAMLSDITADVALDMGVRQLAALNLKNGLEAKNPSIAYEKGQRWLGIPEASRLGIKTNLLRSLEQGATKAGRSAAQAIAAIAAVELPERQFGSVITNLATGLARTADPGVATAVITCMGYICSSLTQGGLDSAEVTAILESVVGVGLKAGQPEPVAKAAVEAFDFIIPFCEEVFKDPGKRGIVLGVLFDTLTTGSDDVKVGGFVALNSIARLYYSYLGDHLQPLFNHTTTAINTSPSVPVKCRAIEFWNIIAETEVEIAEGLVEGPCLNFTTQAMQHLVTAVQTCLMQQNDDPDDTTSGVAVMAGVLLRAMAQVNGPATLAKMMAFIDGGFTKPTWREREASTLALGALLSALPSNVCPEGSRHSLAQVAQAAVSTLLQRLVGPHTAPGMAMAEESVFVRDTSAWAIGVIAEQHFEVLRSIAGVAQPGGAVNATWKETLTVLQGGLKDEPRVAMNAAYALHNISQSTAEFDAGMPTNMLSGEYLNIFRSLLMRMQEDAEEAELLSACAACVVQMVEDAPEQEEAAVQELLPVVCQAINAALGVLGTQGNLPAARRAAGTQMVTYCGILQAVFGTLSADKLQVQMTPGVTVEQTVMTQIVTVCSLDSGAAKEEALMLLLAVVENLEEGFSRYFPNVDPIITSTLAKPDEELACGLALLLIGTMGRCAPNAMNAAQLSTKYVQQVAMLLPQRHVPGAVKVPAAQCLGELATCMGAGFKPMVADAMGLLAQFHDIAFPADDELEGEKLMEMRAAMLESYIGIVQAFMGENKAHAPVLVPHLPKVVKFLQTVYQDSVQHEGAREPEVFKNMCSLVLDLVAVVGKPTVVQLGLVPRLPTGANSWLGDVATFSDMEERKEWADETGNSVEQFAMARGPDGHALVTVGADVVQSLS